VEQSNGKVSKVLGTSFEDYAADRILAEREAYRENAEREACKRADHEARMVDAERSAIARAHEILDRIEAKRAADAERADAERAEWHAVSIRIQRRHDARCQRQYGGAPDRRMTPGWDAVVVGSMTPAECAAMRADYAERAARFGLTNGMRAPRTPIVYVPQDDGTILVAPAGRRR